MTTKDVSKMNPEYKKTIPMAIACLSFAISVAIPVVVSFQYFERSHSFDTEESESNEKKKLILFVITLVACVLLYILPSVLLIKGIRNNRPKLMLAWLILTYLGAVYYLFTMISVFFYMTSWSESPLMGLVQSLPYGIALMISVLFTIPIIKLYKQMRTPIVNDAVAPTTPTADAKVVIEEKKSEDDKRYMPIFEDV